MNRDEYNRLSKIILDVCITVHKEMGPGLLESVYELCLMKEFKLRGIPAKHQVYIPLIYKDFELSKEFKIRSIPSILFIPVGEQPQMATGALPKESFVKIIEDVLKVK